MRTLYDCLLAKYPDGIHTHIYCEAGHKLGSGHIRKEDVDKGKPLVCRICQTCKDFKDMREE